MSQFYRFYHSSITGGQIELGQQESIHLSAVCRLKNGEIIELFDGSGKLAEACVVKADKKKTIVAINSVKQFQKSERKIIIACSIAKGERFDWVIEKCTELGVDRIVPVVFERTVKQPKNPKIQERWLNLAISAAKQSNNLFLPMIDAPIEFEKSLKILKEDFPKGTIIFGSLGKDIKSVLDFTANSGDIVCFVGPEGGMTDAEENFLIQNGAVAVKLTETILRIETAAIAFASIFASRK